MERDKLNLGLAFKGMIMGIAEVIPGVSGGTIAFITGIYERLINCIKSFDGAAVKLLFQFKLNKLYRHVDGNFIILLALGMMMGIAIGVYGVGFLLENYPAPLWSFFFGLILASAIYIARMIEHWNPGTIVSILIGFFIAFGVTFLAPAEGSGNLFWVFICGTIAISALILPGVSGSFILLMLGMYTVVRSAAESAASNQDLESVLIMIVFMAGCLIGLFSFARVMSFAFKNYRNITLALLTGFMLGSLRKIWPWRNIKSYLDKDSYSVITVSNSGHSFPEEFQILKEALVTPEAYWGNSQLLISIISGVFGFILLFLFQHFEKGNKNTVSM